MKKAIAVSVVLVVFSVLAIGAAKTGAWNGVIQMQGGKAVLVVGKATYTITNAAAVTGHEGHSVKVTGSLDTVKKEITVEKVEMMAAKTTAKSKTTGKKK